MPLPSYIYNTKDYLSWTPTYVPQIISGGIMELQTRVIVFGDPKSWKSILTLHMGFCLANGLDFFGFKTMRSVVYKLQVELPIHIDHNRVAKYSDSLLLPDHKMPLNFFHHTDNYLKLDSTYGIAKLEKDLMYARELFPHLPMVVILDPLYKLMSGHLADEYDMKKLFDNVDLMKDKLKCSVIIIHHSRKTTLGDNGKIVDRGEEEASGSRFLAGWCDTMIKTTLTNPQGSKDKVRMTFAATRNATDPLPIIDIHWSRKTLHPTLIESRIPEDKEPSLRGLEDESEEE